MDQRIAMFAQGPFSHSHSTSLGRRNHYWQGDDWTVSEEEEEFYMLRLRLETWKTDW